MKLKSQTFEWLAVIENGTIQIPLDYFRKVWSYVAEQNLNFEGELAIVQICLLGENIKKFQKAENKK